jgi:hypothetical protein
MSSLDMIAMAPFPAFAASSFGRHSFLGTIQVTQAVFSTFSALIAVDWTLFIV